MKLTKELESEILNVYNAYWDAYLKGDMQHFANMLDEDLSVFGTAISEVFTNKQEALAFYNATAEQMVGKADFRNRKYVVQLVGDSIFIREQNDLFVLLENEWSFYAHARVTAIFRQQKGEWKLIHQHASFPDNRAEEGEQIAAEKIRSENLELKEAVKRRTVELEYKNRELEIEAALERTRTHSMLMQHSNELDITSRVFHEQLLLLGIDSELSYVWLPDVAKDKHLFWATWNEEENGSTIIQSKSATYDLDRTEPYTAECFIAWESGEPVHVYPVAPDQVKHYLDTWSGIMGDAKNLKPEFFPEGLAYVESFMKYGCFGILVRRNLSEDEKKILFRFTVEFERTYTRFLDLQKAEAQTREAQVEAALERVRSRSMSMHKTDELLDAAELVSRELSNLGVSSMNVSYAFIDQDEKQVDYYSINPVDGKIPPFPFVFPQSETEVMRSILASWKKQEPFNILELDEEATVKHQTWVGEHIQRLIKEKNINIPFTVEGFLAISPKTAVIYTFNFPNGYLFNIGEEKLTQMQEELLLRFTRVFEMTYTRFLDLQKAEEQTRESQIELGLERVRARTMAMQHSNELQDTAVVLFDQMKALGIHTGSCGFNILNKKEASATVWMSSPEGGLQTPFTLPLTKTTIYKEVYEAMKKGEDLLVKEVTGKNLIKHFDYLLTLHGIGDVIKNLRETGYLFPETIVFHFAFFSQGYLSFHLHEPHPQAHDIFIRFAKVFEQTYTRFLDLQKAEAQAREAQIEAALERVRSRTMGMQKSDELKEVIQVVYEQFVYLNILVEHSGFIMDYKEREDMNIWLADKHEVPFQVTIPYFDCAHWNSYNEAKKNGADFFANHLGFEEKNKFYQDLFKLVPGVTEEAKKYYFSAPGLAISTVLLDNVGLYIENFSGIPYTDEENKTLIRFGKVFQQTYTRFSDLQKAEAQAKEARVEAALEKVRSRSLAMHRSEELQEVVTAVFGQLRNLGIETDAINLDVFNDDKKNANLWTAVPGHSYSQEFRIPYNDTAVFRDIYEGMIAGKDLHSKVYNREEKDEFLNFAFEHTDFRHIPEERKAMLYATEASTVSVAYAKHIAIIAQRYREKLFSVEENEILVRFAKVFEQSYVRFLDLQKAEEQAREATIETALERVRSKSMAMHSSIELREVITIIIEQFKHLGFNLDLANFNYINNNNRDWIMWLATPDKAYPEMIHLPYIKHPLFDTPMDAYQKGLDFISDRLTKEEKDSAIQHMYENSLLKDYDSEERKLYVFEGKGLIRSVVFMKQIILTISNFNGIPYTEEQNSILKRFANAFEQSYTRFLDLQKAEAQTRESQIELGLERVRARAMAMQKSGELAELVDTVFKELTRLDLLLDRCIIMIYDPKTHGSTWWMANSEPGSVPVGVFVKYHEHIPYLAYKNAWQARSLKWEYLLEGAIKKEWDAFLFSETELSHLPAVVINGMKSAQRVFLNASFNNFGSLTLSSLEPLSAEHFDILLRFAKVFDLTYTRFNDLQKAEAQARESQIEASLERIRAKAMAMHRSEEIDEVLEVLFDQFDVLGIVPVSTHLTLIDIETNSFTFRETGKGGRKSFGEQKVPIDSMEIWKEAADKWKALDPLSLNKLHFPKESLPVVWQVFHESFASMPEGHKITPEDYPDGIYHTAGNCKFGYIGMNHVRPATEEEEQIVLKFAVEFGRLYQRYLDLQKAEAQTKEAKIEAAMERVRSASLAMHKSEELKYVVKIVFDNLDPLGLKNIDAVIINILHPGSKDFDLWLAVPGQDYCWNFPLAHFDHPIANDFFKAVEQGETLHRKIYSFELKNSYFRYMFEHADNKYLPAERKEFILKGPGYAISAAIARYSSILIHNYRGIPFSDEENSIVMRFSKVLDQTYTRFLDLQKVEAQAREARIEVSLERVRSKAMAMHSSQDLADTIVAFYHELESFSITPRRCGVGLINKGTRIAELSTMNTTGDGKSIEIIGTLKMIGHPVLEGVYDNWLLQREYHPILRGPEIPAYYQLLRPQIAFPDYPDDAVQYGYFFYFPEGGVYAWTEKEMIEEELIIYRRFTSVLSLTYKRYKDLQQAEDLAKQAADDLINLKIEKKRTEDALIELKNTQSQLVQAEKMASLGELTAGIAHEIQNPLNFVNNFSEVSGELLEEMKEQLAIGNKQEATEIADDLIQNLEKILHHGKRADSIVKGMLQHSRSSSGQKEFTDINSLADEYLRLAFHGLRAKDKSFNADLKTDFDTSIGKIEMIPQEIGRVLVNLLNNAFYAVSEKQRKGVNGYEPMVMVSTKKNGDAIELSVKDNGNGIPKEAVEKIFQPFFTTKPTGQGTGLGLSLSYDIVKAHNGEIKVETNEGKGTTFILILPRT